MRSKTEKWNGGRLKIWKRNPLPGALELLASLPLDRWTIVTSCTRSLAEVRIRAAGLPLPKTLITSNDITNGKPHPDPYLKGAAKLGFHASECVVVEDVRQASRAGKMAGARVIAFTTTVEAVKCPAGRGRLGSEFLCGHPVARPRQGIGARCQCGVKALILPL